MATKKKTKAKKIIKKTAKKTAKKPKMVDIEIDLDQKTVDILQKMADGEGVSLNDIMIRALEEALALEKANGKTSSRQP